MVIIVHTTKGIKKKAAIPKPGRWFSAYQIKYIIAAHNNSNPPI
jgi:hypothetical protein